MNYNTMQQAGINAELGVHRFGNNEALYVRCLKKFPNDPHFQDLKDTLDAHDYDQAFRHAHTLKGVAGNLALDPLYQQSSEVCEILRNYKDNGTDGVDELMEKVCASYATVIDYINTLE